MSKKTISVRATEPLQSFLLTLGDSAGGGAEFGLEVLAELYSDALRSLTGVFTRGELSAMIDVANGLLLAPRFIGDHLLADLEDGARLEGLGEKWGYEPKVVGEKWVKLARPQRAALEIWAKGFWRQEAASLEKYVSRLCPS